MALPQPGWLESNSTSGPAARLRRRLEDHLCGGQVSGDDPLLELRASAPDQIRLPQGEQAL